MEQNKNQQPEELEVQVFTLQDEEGNEHEFELIGTCEVEGTHYYAMIPYGKDADESEEVGYVILKGIEEDGEENLITIDDDEEFDAIADRFDDMFSAEIDYDGK